MVVYVGTLERGIKDRQIMRAGYPKDLAETVGFQFSERLYLEAIK